MLISAPQAVTPGEHHGSVFEPIVGDPQNFQESAEVVNFTPQRRATTSSKDTEDVPLPRDGCGGEVFPLKRASSSHFLKRPLRWCACAAPQARMQRVWRCGFPILWITLIKTLSGTTQCSPSNRTTPLPSCTLPASPLLNRRAVWHVGIKELFPGG